MLKNSVLKTALAVFISMFNCQFLHAQSVEYSSKLDFTAATIGNVTFNFDNIASPYSYVGNYTGYTIGLVKFFSNNESFVADSAWSTASYGVSFFSGQYGSPNAVTASFAPTTAIGFDVGSYATPGDAIYVTVSTGDHFLLNMPVAANTTEFVGFTSSAAMTNITFTSLSIGNVFDIIDFQTASATAVPEPVSMALLGVGIAGTAASRRRRQG